jgi:hypothetical protein
MFVSPPWVDNPSMCNYMITEKNMQPNNQKNKRDRLLFYGWGWMKIGNKSRKFG